MRRFSKSSGGRTLKRRKERLPYRSRGTLLSRGELAFFRVLLRAASSHYLIALKVRAADLLTCSDSAWEAGFGHYVSRHHLDFVLCDKSTTEIMAAIELDDRSHRLTRRKTRDEFLNQAFSDARI